MLNAIGAAALGVLIADPRALFGASFQLTFLAVIHHRGHWRADSGADDAALRARATAFAGGELRPARRAEGGAVSA